MQLRPRCLPARLCAGVPALLLVAAAGAQEIAPGPARDEPPTLAASPDAPPSWDAPLPVEASAPVTPGPRNGLSLRQRNALLIGGAGVAFAAYGAAQWWRDGFGGGFKVTREGWFGPGTAYGGTDKLGHMFTNYADVRLLTPVFEAAGNGRPAAVRLAAWTSLGIFTGIEVIDGFSRRWRFSPEDALMNIAGVGLGLLLETHPALDRKFDFRFAYKPSRASRFDPFGDYDGQRFLLVAKADGFEALRDKPVLRYLELGIGYQALSAPGVERRRDIYVGISLNLSRLLADGFHGGQQGPTRLQRGAELAFELVQFPVGAWGRTGLN